MVAVDRVGGMDRFCCLAGSGWVMYVLAAGLLTGVVSCGRKPTVAQRELATSGYALGEAAFFQAAADGDVRVLELMLEGGVELTVLDGDGRNGLHVAALAGSRESVVFLLDAGLKVDCVAAGGETALMMVAEAGQAGMLRVLLDQGADPERKDERMRTAMMVAVDAGQPASVDVLAPYCRDQLDTALLYAAAQGKHHVIGVLTSYGASLHVRHEGGMTPLMLAAENGDSTTVHVLLAGGANRYAINEHGWTAAQVASAAGHEGIAEMLSRDPGEAELGIAELSEEVLWDGAGVVSSAEAPSPTPLSGDGASSGERRSAPRRLGYIGGRTVDLGGGGDRRLEEVLQMRAYRESPLPLMVERVKGGKAEVRMLYGGQQRVSVKPGERIPDSRLRVVSLKPRYEDSKSSDGDPVDLSEVVIEDIETGRRRRLVSQVPATADEPVAVVASRDGRLSYAVRRGQVFRTGGGVEYEVGDVRPGQVVLTERAGGRSVTLHLGQ